MRSLRLVPGVRIAMLFATSIVILNGCVSTVRTHNMIESDMGTRSLWYETGFSRTIYSHSTTEDKFDPETLLADLEIFVEEQETEWALRVLQDTSFRISFFDDNTVLDGWIDVRDRANGRSYYYFNGIQASKPAITREINSSTARSIFNRAHKQFKSSAESVISEDQV